MKNIDKKNKPVNKKVKEKKPFAETRVKPDNSVEVEFKKNPSETTLGKILLLLIVSGMILLPVVLVIILLFKAFN